MCFLIRIVENFFCTNFVHFLLFNSAKLYVYQILYEEIDSWDTYIK
nr:MAG TPA: hypothetical protein [Caudoviricetes sp.]